jgi:hypothetical protein
MTFGVLVRTIVTCVCLSIPLTAARTARQQTACTLEPTEGNRQATLSNNVTARMTWSTCTSMSNEIIFEWPRQQGVPATPRAALERAATFVREWERVTGLVVSPFGPIGDVSKALETRAAQPGAYEFGDNIPVTDNGVAGWDGVWVTLSAATPRPRLTVHYWANP